MCIGSGVRFRLWRLEEDEDRSYLIDGFSFGGVGCGVRDVGGEFISLNCPQYFDGV